MKKFLQTFCASTLLMTMIPMMNAEASAKEQVNVNYEQKANTTINWSTINLNTSDWSAYKEFIQKANSTPSTKEEKQPVVSTTENKQQTTSTNQQTTSNQTTSNSANKVSETDQSSNANNTNVGTAIRYIQSTFLFGLADFTYCFIRCFCESFSCI